MEPEGSLPHSQMTANCPYPERNCYLVNPLSHKKTDRNNLKIKKFSIAEFKKSKSHITLTIYTTNRPKRQDLDKYLSVLIRIKVDLQKGTRTADNNSACL